MGKIIGGQVRQEKARSSGFGFEHVKFKEPVRNQVKR